MNHYGEVLRTDPGFRNMHSNDPSASFRIVISKKHLISVKKWPVDLFCNL